MRVVLKLSDPWEMGEALGWPALPGTVVHTGVSWLVKLDQPFVHANVEYRFLVVSSRHEDKTLADAISEDVPCSIIRTAPERASSEAPCDVSWWRGGHAMIGSVSATAAQPGAATDQPQAAGR